MPQSESMRVNLSFWRQISLCRDIAFPRLEHLVINWSILYLTLGYHKFLFGTVNSNPRNPFSGFFFADHAPNHVVHRGFSALRPWPEKGGSAAWCILLLFAFFVQQNSNCQHNRKFPAYSIGKLVLTCARYLNWDLRKKESSKQIIGKINQYLFGSEFPGLCFIVTEVTIVCDRGEVYSIFQTFRAEPFGINLQDRARNFLLLKWLTALAVEFCMMIPNLILRMQICGILNCSDFLAITYAFCVHL